MDFNLKVVIPCEPPALQVTPATMADVQYILGDPTYTLSTIWTTNEGSCSVTFAHEVLDSNDAAITTLDTVIAFDGPTMTFTITQTSDQALIGDYKLKITPSTDTPTALTDNILIFNFKIVDPCENPAI